MLRFLLCLTVVVVGWALPTETDANQQQLAVGWALPTETYANQPRAVGDAHPTKSQPAKKPRERTVAELTALVRKSVVVVSYNGRDGRPKGVGSGFIISSDGLIATNLHVIGEARPIVVRTSDGKRHEVTSIYATESKMDLAILKVDAKNLPVLPLGDSDTLQQGQKIVALGNPRGLKFSVVAGVVSGRRKIDGMPVIQLAIPIEQGNSGGPLLDMQGRVHGILTLKSLVTNNLGFAVTINALKPLMKKPNPVAMKRWLTIGTMDPHDWTVLFGANWRQRAGRIHVEGRGRGVGGRSLVLSKRKPPKLPFEMAVQVKLDDEAGAAGLVFHAGGLNRHYGFYPSNGKLRLSRFEGPDVFSWKVLRMLPSKHYRPGEWNTLKVRLEKGRIKCFVNDKLVIESTDTGLTSGQVGLAKFRDTVADFRGFRVAKTIPPTEPDAKTIAYVAMLVADIGTKRPPRPKLIARLQTKATDAGTILQRRAKKLEAQAKHLRHLARLVHESETRRQLAELFEQKDEQIDLLKAALLIARLDNAEVAVDGYLQQVNRMTAEVSKRMKKGDSEAEKLKRLDSYLFTEMGFHGSRTDYYSRSNSYLNEVIDDREGLPIAVSVLYMEMARRLGLKVVGVGLPGHFVVRFEPKKGKPQLIDPFDRGKRMTRKQAEQQVEFRTRRKFDPQYLVAQSKKAILERMLRNLMGTAAGNEDAEGLLRYIETILVLNPDSGRDRWGRAMLNYRTGRLTEALADAEFVLKHPPDGVNADSVRRLKEIVRQRLSESGE